MTDIHLQIAKALDATLNGDLPRKIGFVVLTFPFGDAPGRRVNYVSNAERADIVTSLKEIVARFEGQPLQGGTA